jgi:hypothetical protein
MRARYGISLASILLGCAASAGCSGSNVQLVGGDDGGDDSATATGSGDAMAGDGGGDETSTDGGAPDVTASDVATSDVSTSDAGASDATTGDATLTDASATDATSGSDAVASDASITDATASDAAATDAASDAVASDGGASDVGPIDAGCPPLGATPTVVYVDHAAAPGGNGTHTCPFNTILAATSLTPPTITAPRTVLVTGGTAGGATVTYAESGVLVIPQYLTVLNSGPRDKTVITVATDGACVGAGAMAEKCSVHVTGGTLEGFTVSAALDDGIAIDGAGLVPVLRRVAVTGSKGSGIYVHRNADLVGVASTGNQVHGLLADGTATVAGFDKLTITETSADNTHFDANGQAGIRVNAGILLDVTGGTASANVLSGVNLSAGTGPMTNAHSFSGFTANDNGAASAGGRAAPASGIEIATEASAKIHCGTFTGNSYNGITKGWSASSVLDLGTASAGGGNVFASPSSTNGQAGLCVWFGGIATNGAFSAEGNAWKATSCPIVETKLASAPGPSTGIGCYPMTRASYSDIAWSENLAAMPDATAPVTAPTVCTKAGSC